MSADEQLIRPATYTPTRDDLHGRSWFGDRGQSSVGVAAAATSSSVVATN